MPNNEIGEIFSASEADQQFGQVLSSVQINSNQLRDFIEMTDNYLMFKIINGVLYVLGDGRSVLSPSEGYIDEEEVFALYSKSKVDELISTGGASVCTVETRSDVISITNGQYTLEVGSWCPPYCEGN